MFIKYTIVLVAIYLLPFCASLKPNCAGAPPSTVNPRDCCEKATVIDNSVFEACFSKFDMSKQPPKEGKGLKGPLMNAEVNKLSIYSLFKDSYSHALLLLLHDFVLVSF